ncbi:dihydropyrimidine dehydrogenase, partial [Candidatus Margulisiibacteriota bacterium]
MAEKKIRPHMNERPVADRIRDFDEVPVGFTVEQARAEAKRCIQCKNPKCVAGCPVEIDIPGFLKFVAEGDFSAAAKKIKETNALPAICGRVCPQEDQCEKVCILGIKGEPIAIGALERFVADWERENVRKSKVESPSTSLGTSRKSKAGNNNIAVVGSGPAGLT